MKQLEPWELYLKPKKRKRKDFVFSKKSHDQLPGAEVLGKWESLVKGYNFSSIR